MRLIDHTPYLTEKGQISLLHKIIGTFRFGDFWVEEVKAQQIVIDALESTLVPGYALLRNIQLPGVKITLPMVLVGPSGMYLLAVTTLKGSYHAIEGTWQMENRGKIRPVHPNLQRETSRLALALEKHLKNSGLDTGTVEGVLIATELSMYIQKENPIVRIVMRDTIDLLADGINRADQVLSVNKVNRIVDFLSLSLPVESQADDLSSLQAGLEEPLPAPVPSPASDQDLSIDLDRQPLEFGGESTPWDLMKEFNFNPGEGEEKPGEVFTFQPPTQKTGGPRSSGAKLPPQLKSVGSRFTVTQWIIISLASLVIIMLVAFILKTYGSIQ